MNRTGYGVFSLASFLLLMMVGDLSSAEEKVSFRKEIAPILLKKCQSCHGPKKAKGKYRTDSYNNLMKAGAGEIPGITPDDLEKSELYYRLITDEEDERMPADADPLPQEEIALFKRWIKQGANSDSEDPASPLSEIVPPPIHPQALEKYPATLPVTALTYSKDGKYLYSSGYHEVLVWDVEKQVLKGRIGNVAERTYGLNVSPDNKMLAVASGNPGRLGEVRIFDLSTNELISVPVRSGDVCFEANFSPDGKKLAVAGSDGMIRILETASWKTEITISNHADWVYTVSWSQDGKHLISGSKDKTAKIFSARDGKRLITFSGHSGAVTGAGLMPDGKKAFSVSTEKRLTLWNVTDGKKVKDLATFQGLVGEIKASKDELFVVDEGAKVSRFARSGILWNKDKDYRNGLKGTSLSIAVHQDLKMMAVGTHEGMITLINSGDGKVIKSYKAAP